MITVSSFHCIRIIKNYTWLFAILGPVTIVQEDGKTYIIGVHSVGDPDLPDVAERVSRYVTWIKDQVQVQVLDILDILDDDKTMIVTETPTQRINYGVIFLKKKDITNGECEHELNV